MLTFRMDRTNFGQGSRDGTRLLTGQGVKVDFAEFAPDGGTLGLWHLHNGACEQEGTGLEDASGGGRHLVNYGAASVEDGYRFVRAEGDYMTGAWTSEPARAQLTLECWVQQWLVPTGAVGQIAGYGPSSSNQLYLVATRAASPASSFIEADLYIAGNRAAVAFWQGAAADAVLAGSAPWHVAVVLNSPTSLTLFVNGVPRAQVTSGIVNLPGGNTQLWLGRWFGGWSGWDLSAVLDEVRLSAVARYSSTFLPCRLLASGAFTSPTFDTLRVQADWLDLFSEQDVPPGCQITWQVRAADETDAFGHPQALWQPYAGPPADLPDGRYFQWRSVLAPSADRLASPTLRRVEARASEAGYNLYRAAGGEPEALDYAEPFARVGPGVTDIRTGPLAAGTVHWFSIRPVDERGIESPTTEHEARLELDEAGQPVAERPAGVLALEATPRLLGTVRLRWRYRVGHAGVLPQVFRVFGDGGSGTINYAAPLGEVPYLTAKTSYAWDSPALAEGVVHQLAVRAVSRCEVSDEQPAVVAVTPDATPPGPVDALEAEVVP